MRAIKHHALTITLLGAVAAATWAYEPSVARAQESNEQSRSDGAALFLLTLIGSGMTAISTLIYVGKDIAYGARGEWLPPEEVGGQLMLGAATNFVMGTAWTAWTVLGADSTLLFIPITHFIFAGWFLTHSILSLELYEPSDDKAGDRRWSTASIDFGIAPIEGGAMGSLVGRF